MGSAEPVPFDPAVVTGTVMDSTRMAPLEGAEIRLVDTDHTVLSDTDGSYRMEIAARTPGVRLVTGPGQVSAASLRIHRVNGCEPSIYVDGARTWLEEIDFFSPHQIEMVEIYRGVSQLPGEMADNNARRCGAIGIWTRRGH